jgi:uncharacterized small protein (DUF1192 family)
MKAQGEKKMKTFQQEINHRIVSLRFEIDNYRADRNYNKVAELQLEIARLQGILRTAKNLQANS